MIEHFLWTSHAEKRLAERDLSRHEVELAICLGEGRPNLGAAGWRVSGVCANGLRFVVVYDYPARGDSGTARIVSVWTVDESRTGLYRW
jgi:hypothetical protein